MPITPLTRRDVAVMLPRLARLLVDAHEIARELPASPIVDALCRAIDGSITDVGVLTNLHHRGKLRIPETAE